MNVVTQLTQFVGRDVINKNTTDLAVPNTVDLLYLAVRCSTGSVELCRYKRAFTDSPSTEYIRPTLNSRLSMAVPS